MAVLPKVSTSILDEWRNFHKTIKRRDVTLHALDPASPVPSDFAGFLDQTGKAARAMLAGVAASGQGILPLGSTWSFSDLLKSSGALYRNDGAPGIFRLKSGDLADGGNARRLVMVGGGTRIHDLNIFLESPAERLSLHTSGAHDGHTIGGITGTGTHGSALQFGPFQNHLRGIHLVTGPNSSVWIEKGPVPLLAPDRAKAFSTRQIYDADIFAAAQVHLGGLGLVNGALLEVADYYDIEVLRIMETLKRSELQALQEGRYRDFLRGCGVDREPYYLEIIINPFAPFKGVAGGNPGLFGARPALISAYFKRERVVTESVTAAAAPARRASQGPLDVLDLLAGAIAQAAAPRLVLESFSPESLLPTSLIADLVTAVFATELTGKDKLPVMSWGKANGPFKPRKLGPIESQLHNDSFAIPRERLLDALDAMIPAFRKKNGGHLVSTLRFVPNSQGKLAFTRFPETVVFNWDGMRTPQSRKAGVRIAEALEKAAIPFSQHWGKMGDITPARFTREYGDPAVATTKAGQWKAAREGLLEPAMLPLIGNDNLRKWGLMP